MPDLIAAQFRGPWVLEASGELGGIGIWTLQAAWRALTPKQQDALLRLETDQTARVHHTTLASLVRHGLVDPHGLTEAGALVVKHRPQPGRHAKGALVKPSMPDRIHGRPVVDVHLPETQEPQP